MADNSILKIALDADNNVWWTIIDAADFVILHTIAIYIDFNDSGCQKCNIIEGP